MTRNRAAEVLEAQAAVLPCPKPGKQKRGKRSRTNPRKELEARLEAAIRELVFWRDGNQCIERSIDGARCGGPIQWGHFIPRSQSGWLKFVYYNTFAQCRDHNGLHKRGDQTMAAAIAAALGPVWMLMLNAERDYHRGCKVTVEELKCRLEIVRWLLDHRPCTFAPKDLVDLGYYGPVQKASE